MNRKLFLTLVLTILSLPVIFAQFTEENLFISVSEEGTAKVTQSLKPSPIISRIQVQLVSDKVSNVVAIDENDSFLNTEQVGNSLTIDTLGSSHVTLKYGAQIIDKAAGVWNISYQSDVKSTILLPSSSSIVSLNNIPLDISNNSLLMPPDKISLSYIIKPLRTQTISVSSGASEEFVHMMTASNVENFKNGHDFLSFNVDGKNPMLAIIPKTLLAGEYQISLNGEQIQYDQYENATHNWLRFEPSGAGSLKIVGTPQNDLSVIQENKGGGCLIATAAYGSELAPQVQLLREIRNNAILSTDSGKTFMAGFNSIYYSFSPTVANWERQYPVFKELVQLAITPLLMTLSLLGHPSIDSEVDMLAYGISVLLLNTVIYFGTPAFVILTLKKRWSLNKPKSVL